MFTKATFGQKIAGAGLALLVLTLGLSYSSLLVIQRLGAHLNKAANETTSVVDLIGDVKSGFYQLQGETKRVQTSYIIQNTKVDAALSMKLGECKACHTAASGADTAQSAAVLVESIRKLNGLIDDSASRDALKKLENGALQVQQFQKAYLEAVTRNQFADAHEVLTEKMDPLLKQLQDNTQALERAQQQVLAASSRSADKEISQSRMIVWVVIGLCLFVLTATFQLVRGIIRKLGLVAGRLFEHAGGVAKTAASVSSSGDMIAERAVTQATAIDSTSSTAEVVSGTAQENHQAAEEVARLAAQVQEHVTGANRTLQQLTVAMEQIDASSHQISKIMKVIDEIASQTNILALNAAVEAARSGDAGLGFAVVADEVRSLAQRCAEAARDSEQLIQASVERSVTGRQRVEEVSCFVKSVTADVSQVNDIARRLQERSRSQASSIASMHRSIEEIRSNTHEFAAAAEESAAAGQTLRRQADELSGAVDEMTANIGAGAH